MVNKKRYNFESCIDSREGTWYSFSGNPIKKVGIPKGACMKLSTRGKYGLYAMYYLAAHAGEGPQTLQNISTVGVPKQYLEQILGNLRRAGLVSTTRNLSERYH